MANRMKVAAKEALCGLFKYSGAASLQEAYARWKGRASMVILLFHRISDKIPEDGLTVPPFRFRQMCRLLQRQFRVVPLAEIFRIVRSGAPFPPRTVAVTFDDCYGDNLLAARILAEHGLPATFFIPPGFVGTDHVFDWDCSLPVRLPNLTWPDLEEMVALGFDIGSHSLTHPNLAQLSDADATRELVESKKILEQKLSRPVHWFAYPYGGPEHFRPEQLALVRQAGYEECLSAHYGFLQQGNSQVIIPREPVPYFHGMLNLELYLRGCLHWFYNAKRSWRSPRAHQDISLTSALPREEAARLLPDRKTSVEMKPVTH